MVKKASFKEAKDIYRKYIMRDFLPEERIPYKKYKRLTKKKVISTYKFYDEKVFLGYFSGIDKKDVLFLEYLGIIPEKRGQGLGTKLLEEIKNSATDKDYIAFEVDDLLMARDENELESIKKRRTLYFKSGFEELDNIEYSIHGFKYNIFVYKIKNKSVKKQEILERIKNIYKDDLTLKEKYFKMQIIENK